MKDKLTNLKDIMYDMFKDGRISTMEMKDYEIMWEALMASWKIQTPEKWEEFIEEINCLMSNKYDWFSMTFDKYFKPEN